MGALNKIRIEGTVFSQGVPIARDPFHSYDSERKRGRFRWHYLTPGSNGMGAHPVDVSYAFEFYTARLSGGVRIVGQDDISKLSFALDCTFDLWGGKYTIKGSVGRISVNEKSKTIFGMQEKVLKLIYPILTGQKI